MDKILNKSKSMLFGRKRGKDDSISPDSESFYDFDEYSPSSSSQRVHTQTLGLKTKNSLPTKLLVHSTHPSHAPGPSSREIHDLYNANANFYTSRRDTQPTMQPRQKSLPMGRSSSVSESQPPTVSLNAHTRERYRLEMNPERGPAYPTGPTQGPLGHPGVSNQLHQTNTFQRGNADAREDPKGPSSANSYQLPDKSFRNCSISAPITSGLRALETKFDPSTNRRNVQALRSSAESAVTKHIPTLYPNSTTYSSRTGVSKDGTRQQDHPRTAELSGGGLSPLKGRRSLNFFNITNQTLNPESSSTSVSTASLNNGKRNLPSFPRLSNDQGSTAISSSSSDTQYGSVMSNLLRYESRNSSQISEQTRNESVATKNISSPFSNDDNGGQRPFHARAASDNSMQPHSVQPLSLRSQPRFHEKKLDGFGRPLLERNEKQGIDSASPDLYGSSPSSALQTSASLPTPPTSSTTLSFIAGQLDVPEFDSDKGGSAIREEGSKFECIKISPLTRADLEIDLKIQNAKVSELCERVSGLSDQLNEEITTRKLFGKRISHLENEIRGLRWIISERDRVKRAAKNSETVDSDSRGSSRQATSEDSNSIYEASRTSNTIEKDQDNDGKIESGAAPKYECPHGLNVSLRTNTDKANMNRQKRFGLALDPSPDLTPVGRAPFLSSSPVDYDSTPSQRWGGKV